MSTQPALAQALPPVYAVAALRLAFPLLLLPLMAVRLGLQEFGRLSQLLLLAALLSVLVEGGFGAAATRHAVVADPARRALLLQQVFSARCCLSVLSALLALAAGWWVGAAWPEVLLLAALALALGWPAQWYLQASGQWHRFAPLEGAVLLLWLLLAWWLAHSVVVYLLLNALALVSVALLGWHRARAALVPLPALWSRAQCAPGLRLGGAMLPVSLAGAAYSYALPVVAAAQMPRAELGLFYLADRWIRSLLMAAEPLVQLVYPRIVERFATGLHAALTLALRWAAAGFGVGCALLLSGVLAWPWLAPRLQTGIDSAALAPVLLTLSCLLPLLLGWKLIGLWMLGSARFDAAYRTCMIVGAIVGVGVVLLLPVTEALTLARTVLAVELLVIAIAVGGIVWKTRWASTSTT